MRAGRGCVLAILAAWGCFAPAVLAETLVFAATGAGGTTTPDPPYKEMAGGWSYLGFRSAASPAGSGSRSCTSGNPAPSIRLTPTLASAGGQYDFQITHPYRSDTSSNRVSPDIIVNLAVTGGSLTDDLGGAVTSTTAFQKPGADDWETVGRLSLNPGVTTPVITLTATVGYTDRFYADGFRFVQVPEPATLSLLALAGAGLLVRPKGSGTR